jgi:hypothetical protein
MLAGEAYGAARRLMAMPIEFALAIPLIYLRPLLLLLLQSTMNFPDVSRAKSAIRNIFPIIDRPSAIDPCSSEGIVPLGGVHGELEVTGLCFHYPTRPSVEVLW